MTPDDMAALHKRCFETPRPYTAREFETTLAGIGAFLVDRKHGFLIGRVIADEVELITLAVDPAHRRKGIASELMDAFIGTSHRLGARMAFLDVAEGNASAQALYDRFGFVETDRRVGYYRDPNGRRSDAVVMLRDL